MSLFILRNSDNEGYIIYSGCYSFCTVQRPVTLAMKTLTTFSEGLGGSTATELLQKVGRRMMSQQPSSRPQPH